MAAVSTRGWIIKKAVEGGTEVSEATTGYREEESQRPGQSVERIDEDISLLPHFAKNETTPALLL